MVPEPGRNPADGSRGVSAHGSKQRERDPKGTKQREEEGIQAEESEERDPEGSATEAYAARACLGLLGVDTCLKRMA